MSCIQEVFPDAKITPNGTNNYPITVTITGDVGGQKMKIWSGSQRNLFRKYATQREKSMQEMKRNLAEFAEDVVG